LQLGFGLLAILPTTVASATAFSALAGGHTGNALFASLYSNALAVWLVPALAVSYLSLEAGTSIAVGPIFGQLGLLILLPLLSGQSVRRVAPLEAAWLASRTQWLSPAIIALMVHLAFARSIASGLLETLAFPVLLAVLGGLLRFVVDRQRIGLVVLGLLALHSGAAYYLLFLRKSEILGDRLAAGALDSGRCGYEFGSCRDFNSAPVLPSTSVAVGSLDQPALAEWLTGTQACFQLCEVAGEFAIKAAQLACFRMNEADA
jgi:sodium/bile acid cotransporter 7